MKKRVFTFGISFILAVLFCTSVLATPVFAASEPSDTVIYEAEDSYLHFFKATENTVESYSNNKYVGGANYAFYQSEESLIDALDHNSSYIAFTVNAPKDGTYAVALRYKFGCTENSQEEYEAFTEKYGYNPYVCILVNGEVAYRFYHPTKCGWISQTQYVQVELKEGLNVLCAMTPPAEVAAEFTNAYVDFDYLIMDSALSAVRGDYYIPGDCNNDNRVSLLDLLRLKSYLADSSVSINKASANLDLDEDIFIGANDLSYMITLIMSPSDVKELTVIKPTPYLDYTRIQSEVYGVVNRFASKSDTAVAGMIKDTSNAQSYSSIINDGYLEKSQLPYVSYLVNAPSAGTYTLISNYILSLNDGYNYSDYYTVISVNDTDFYQDFFTAKSSGSNINLSTTEIKLNKGINVIRIISAVAETYPMVNWADHNYIQINSAEVKAVAPDSLTLYAGASDYIGHYNNIQPTFLGGCSTTDARSAGITYDSLSLKNLDVMPYFSYTVDVPADGYYDIDLYYNTGDASYSGTEGYFALLLDGNKSKIYFNNPTAAIEYNRANASVYMTQGTHTLVVTSCFGWNGSDPSYRDWCDFGAMVFHGGITKSAVQEDVSFEGSLNQFPESYKASLRALHKQYPNWVFVADKLTMSFDDAVAIEYGTLNRKQVSGSSGYSWRSMQKNAYDWSTGTWADNNGGWYSASREVIAYYMDPRNFFTASEIFMFMQQSFDPNTQTKAGLRKVVAGTYLENGYDGNKDAYINDIMAAAEQSNVNPYVIASTLIVEQGSSGNGALISGTETGYEGYYNYFNIKASGSTTAEVIANGLEYAKSKGWNTRRASIIGGAEFYGSSYINVGQDTYFYKDYNLVNGYPGNIWKQYAQAVHDAHTSGVRMSATYVDDPESSLTFRIPVYTSIADTPAVKPAQNSNLNNYYITGMSVSGLSPAFDMYTYSYSLSVSGNTTVNITLPSGASLASESSYKLSAGSNTVKLVIKAQTGFTNTYTLKVNASTACTLTISQ